MNDNMAPFVECDVKNPDTDFNCAWAKGHKCPHSWEPGAYPGDAQRRFAIPTSADICRELVSYRDSDEICLRRKGHEGDHMSDPKYVPVVYDFCQDVVGGFPGCLRRAGHSGDHMNNSTIIGESFVLVDDPDINGAMDLVLRHVIGENPTDEDVAHLGVLLKSVVKYHEQNKKHKSLWKVSGWLDAAFHIRHKGNRTFNQAMEGYKAGEADGVDDMDDVIDLVNYCVFYIRSVEEKMGM